MAKKNYTNDGWLLLILKFNPPCKLLRKIAAAATVARPNLPKPFWLIKKFDVSLKRTLCFHILPSFLNYQANQTGCGTHSNQGWYKDRGLWKRPKLRQLSLGKLSSN